MRRLQAQLAELGPARHRDKHRAQAGGAERVVVAAGLFGVLAGERRTSDAAIADQQIAAPAVHRASRHERQLTDAQPRGLGQRWTHATFAARAAFASGAARAATRTARAACATRTK